tara:strand:- start:1260 stop:1520 length:261 start_codon:yes stop_codon:yes gene_type:complete
MVAPVVVKPDIDSKKELTKDRLGVPNEKGIDAIKVSIIQEIKVKMKADKTSTSLFLFLNVKEIFKPVKRHTIEIKKKTAQSVPRVT